MGSVVAGSVTSGGWLWIGEEAGSVFGGPVAEASTEMSDGGALVHRAPVGDPLTPEGEIQLGFALFDEALVVHPSNPLGALQARDGIVLYRVERGDTLSRIANRFGVSLNTILWANPSLVPNALSVGEELSIPPISDGVLHRVEEGESFASVAVLYGIREGKLMEANPSKRDPLSAGTTLIVPGGRPLSLSRAATNLVSVPGYFKMPTTGWNWGKDHENAVDIANVCGTPVYAAQEGLVTETGSPATWNKGYGGFVRIEHPNGAATVYAHLQEVSVSPGDYLVQGDALGEIGNTGNAHGRTGCHLHFGVEGGFKNPFIKT